jgi:hypothetical protein
VADTLAFRLTNRVANPVLLRLLRTRAGRRAGRRLAVLRYTGLRTGRPHELVAMYVRTAATVWVLVGAAEHKSWWRNLTAPADVVLWLAGERMPGRAVAVEGAAQPDEAWRGLTAYLAGMPVAARSVGVRDRDDPAQVRAAAERAVLVRVDLRPEEDAAG